MDFLSRYESVRKVRELSFRKTERQFMESLAVLDQNKMVIRDLERRRTAGILSLSGPGPDEGPFGQTSAWRTLCYDYVNWLNCEVVRIESLAAALLEEVSHCRQKWQEAKRDLEKVEHLIEAERSGRQVRGVRREERGQDDLSMSRWGMSTGRASAGPSDVTGNP